MQQQHDEVLDAEDVLGKRIDPDSAAGQCDDREENAGAALEVMSRFAADPKWLIYLPPTMSPCETSDEPGLLEHPARRSPITQRRASRGRLRGEAHGLPCRGHRLPGRAAAGSASGLPTGSGIVYTRTGRRFFNDPALEAASRPGTCRPRPAPRSGPSWRRLGLPRLRTDAVVGQGPGALRTQYAAVGAAGLGLAARGGGRPCAGGGAAGRRGTGSCSGPRRSTGAGSRTWPVRRAYRRYCWPVDSLADLKLAPFHLLATEGHVHTEQDHPWHMETLAGICRAIPSSCWPPPTRSWT